MTKKHIREPGSWTQTLCAKDAKPGDLAFKTTERELDDLAADHSLVCLRCIEANRKHLGL
jgi:hypothetical protein